MASDIRIVIQALSATAALVVKKITLDIVANLQRAPSEGGTPVDTGWARANWIPVIGRPSGKAANRPGDDEQTRAAATQLRGQQQNAVAAIAATYTLVKGRVTISNNVPYILGLNAGSSKQAPRGFVQAAIRKALQIDLSKSLGVQ